MKLIRNLNLPLLSQALDFLAAKVLRNVVFKEVHKQLDKLRVPGFFGIMEQAAVVYEPFDSFSLVDSKDSLLFWAVIQ